MSVGVWDAALIGAKAIAYAATLGAAGAVFFLKFCGERLAAAERLGICRIVWGSAVLSVAARAAQIMVSAGSMSGDAAGMLDGSLMRMIWQAGAGRANLLCVFGLLMAAFGVLRDRPRWYASLGAVMASTSFASTGHARSLHPDVLPVLLLSVHLLGVAFWLGGLAPLLIVVRNGDLPRIAATTARFGALSLFVVGGLIAAALGLLSMLLGGIVELWESSYGRSMLLKLSLVAGLLCLAAFNKLNLTPRLLGGDARAVRSLRVSVLLELLAGASILAVTAALTTIAGPPALD